ncbi:SRPBCC family protein [Hydrocarboniphaga sp.]|uniref:SRPBCC family protein n=1 Tax=Hydrocarboniphaga sp. TaxID=2033016 RepID=UPI003D113AFC
MSFVIDKSIEIRAPAGIVWEVITDLAAYPQWNPFVVECSSSLKPGDAIDMRVKLFAKAQKQREWMHEHVPGRRLSYRMKPAPLRALASARSHEVKAIGGDRTRYQSHFELRGWLLPLVRGMMGTRLEAGFAGMTEGIRQRAESLWAQRNTATG